MWEITTGLLKKERNLPFINLIETKEPHIVAHSLPSKLQDMNI